MIAKNWNDHTRTHFGRLCARDVTCTALTVGESRYLIGIWNAPFDFLSGTHSLQVAEFKVLAHNVHDNRLLQCDRVYMLFLSLTQSLAKETNFLLRYNKNSEFKLVLYLAFIFSH